MKRVVPAIAALCLVLSACSDPAPQPQKPGRPEAKPAPVVAKPGTPVEPTIASIFATGEDCQKAGYTAKQCNDAWGVANAMSLSTPATYTSKKDCEKFFRHCEERFGKGPGGDVGYAPVMAGFSLGDEVPGVNRQPTADHPQWYAPAFKDTKGRWVYLLQDKDNKLMAVPAKPGVPAKPVGSPEAPAEAK